MIRRSLFRYGMPLGFAVFLLSAAGHIANAETPQTAGSPDSQANEVDPVSPRAEPERRPPPATPREAKTLPVRPAAAAKTSKDPLAQLESQIREAKREREEAAQEHQLLKARLAEMEKKIQELMQQNAERDARLRAQAGPAK